jgi:hypothetical protein
MKDNFMEEVSHKKWYKSFGQPIEDPLSDKSLFELAIFSTFSFIFAALFVQFLLTLQTTIILHSFSISFIYRLFDIRFTSADSTKWPEDRIYIVYGLGTIIFSLIGFFLINILKNIRIKNWKVRLWLTWVAFLMVHTFPAGIIAGTVFFNGVGIAYQWLIDSFQVRCLIAVVVLLITMFYRHFWISFFLKASYSKIFFTEMDNQKVLVRNIFFNPLILGFIVLLFFNVPYRSWYWLICLFFIVLVAFPSISSSIRYGNLFIIKSEKQIFSSLNSILYQLLILVFLWVLGYYKIRF